MINSLDTIHSIFFLKDEQKINMFYSNPDNTKYILTNINSGISKNSMLVKIHDRFEEYTPLHLAIEFGDISIVKKLLTYGANMDQISMLGSPLHVSVLFDKKSIYNLLIKSGANINKLDFRANNAFHILLSYSSDHNSSFINKWIRILAKSGCDINKKNSDGYLPLYKNEDSRCIEVLLNCGADINLLYNDGIVLPRCLAHLGTMVNIASGIAVFKNLKKCLIMKCKLHDKNMKLYFDLLNQGKKDDKFFQTTNIRIFNENCLKEINEMKNIKFNAYTSLYEILFLDSTRMAIFSENKMLKKYCDKECFPNFNFLLRRQMIKGQVRKPFLKPTLLILKYISNNKLCEDILDRILFHLTNEECDYLIGIYDYSIFLCK